MIGNIDDPNIIEKDFGKLRFFDVGISSGKFASLDNIWQVGWHIVNDSYFVSRIKGLSVGMLILTVSGEGRIIIQNTEYVARAGMVAVIPNDIPYSFYCSPGHKWEFYWVHYIGACSTVYSNDILKGGKPLIYVGVPFIEDNIKNYVEIKTNGVEREIDDAEWLIKLLQFLLRITAVQHYHGQEYDQISAILYYMENHFSEAPSVKKLADIFHYSEEHLIRMVKKRTGMSPFQYWNLQRLRHSCRDLELEQKCISVIALEHGYASVAGYTKQFQKHFKMSPTEYREAFKTVRK